MQITVLQFVTLAHQQIAEELFEVFRLLLDTLSHIFVVRTDKGVPKIPRILGKNVVPYLESYGTQVLDGKNRSRACLSAFAPTTSARDTGKHCSTIPMRIAAEMGAGCLLICGNIAFYGKSGFVVASTRGIRYADDPESDAPYFLCKELQEGFLDGITGSYRDPEPYFVAMRNPEAFEKYDKEFPPKEKLVLPGQLG